METIEYTVDPRIHKSMVSNRPKNTRPELMVRKYLHANGYRYRLHVRNLPGSPDIVLPRYKSIILVHGCFWHHHESCKKAVIPKSRVDYWTSKFSRNIMRDANNVAALEKLGWRVLVVWECEVMHKKTNRLSSIIEWIRLS